MGLTRLDAGALSEYMTRGDAILHALGEHEHRGDERFASHRWLRENATKRLVFEYLYADLLEPVMRRRVLDVGGGFTSLTRLLLQHHEYTLMDILAHDAADALRAVEAEIGHPFWLAGDWWSHAPIDHDVVVANDLFPNVDQRLELFLDRYLPHASEIRLSLTYYPDPRFYVTRRLDGDEVLVLLAWNGEQVRRVLEGYRDRLVGPNLDLLTDAQPQSLFPNGRQVALVTLRGDIA